MTLYFDLFQNAEHDLRLVLASVLADDSAEREKLIHALP